MVDQSSKTGPLAIKRDLVRQVAFGDRSNYIEIKDLPPAVYGP